jgi:hypothetical protein
MWIKKDICFPSVYAFSLKGRGMQGSITIKKRWLVPACFAGILLLALCLTVRLDLQGDWEGIYLLKGDTPCTVIASDDLFFGEQHPVLYHASLAPLKALFSLPEGFATAASAHSFETGIDEPFDIFSTGNERIQPLNGTLYWQWREATGRGYVISSYPDGTKLLTSFGRYRDGAGAAPPGLLVGGNMPHAEDSAGRINLNASGMAYYAGGHWYHLWCSVNEAIIANGTAQRVIPPSQWHFLDSTVVKGDPQELVLTSRHAIDLDGTSLLMERSVVFRAGDRHFVLVNRVTNTGRTPADYSYVYGDEPWLGKYGTSAGDVGWLDGRLVTREESVSGSEYRYAGLVDYGNDLVGEGHTFTGTANFIEWLGDERPARVFFSNKSGDAAGENRPLTGDSRFIGLDYGARLLQPGRSHTYVLAVGMAVKDARTGFPVKPPVNFALPAHSALLKWKRPSS